MTRVDPLSASDYCKITARLESKRITQLQTKLLQLCVLGFGSDEDWNVRVGIFPEREEILIGRLGFGVVVLQGVGAGEAEMSECSDGFVEYNSAMVENFLELGSGFAALMAAR